LSAQSIFSGNRTSRQSRRQPVAVLCPPFFLPRGDNNRSAAAAAAVAVDLPHICVSARRFNAAPSSSPPAQSSTPGRHFTSYLATGRYIRLLARLCVFVYCFSARYARTCCVYVDNDDCMATASNERSATIGRCYDVDRQRSHLPLAPAAAVDTTVAAAGGARSSVSRYHNLSLSDR
jgi:hypothetical protein